MSKVLLVDDDAMIRSFLKLHFEGHEFEVELAEDGKDALSKAAANVQDLIVLDMNMPVMTGWDAAKELKKDGAPIIAMSRSISAASSETACLTPASPATAAAYSAGVRDMPRRRPGPLRATSSRTCSGRPSNIALWRGAAMEEVLLAASSVAPCCRLWPDVGGRRLP